MHEYVCARECTHRPTDLHTCTHARAHAHTSVRAKYPHLGLFSSLRSWRANQFGRAREAILWLHRRRSLLLAYLTAEQESQVRARSTSMHRSKCGQQDMVFRIAIAKVCDGQMSHFARTVMWKVLHIWHRSRQYAIRGLCLISCSTMRVLRSIAVRQPGPQARWPASTLAALVVAATAFAMG